MTDESQKVVDAVERAAIIMVQTDDSDDFSIELLKLIRYIEGLEDRIEMLLDHTR